MQLKENLRNYCNTIKNKNRNKEYNLIKHKVNSFEEAYDILEKPEYCKCGKKAHFVSLKLGYSKYCSYECLHKDNFYDLNNVKTMIENNTFSKLNVKKLLELYKLSAEEMYKKLFEIKKCTYCENKAIFYSLLKGYSKYCSISCSNKDKDFSRTPEKNTII